MSGKYAIILALVPYMAVFSLNTVPTLQLINKTGNKTGYPAQTITVEVIVGFDKAVFAHVDVAPFSSSPINVPGIPGTFTLQYARGGLMGNTDTRIIQVPVAEGTTVIFYDDSYEVQQPK